MAWMNGHNTLLMTDWLVCLYQTVLREFSTAAFPRDRCRTFHPLLLWPKYSSTVVDFRNTHTYTQTHIPNTLRCHPSFILYALWGVCMHSNCGEAT